jgi:Peptidase family M50.
MMVLGVAFYLFFAVGYLLSILVHETGHLYSAKRFGIKVRFGGFTPFGAFVVHEDYW